MNCPECQHPLDNQQHCSQCGWDWEKSPWVFLTSAYSPNHLVIESLLQAYGLPVKVVNPEVSQFPFCVGPLAEVRFFVPAACYEQAQDLIRQSIDTA